MFPVVTVSDTAALLSEQLGSKHKLWFQHESSLMYLFKEARSSTGEDWSEKVACELCHLLDLPHVRYDLATWKRRRSVVCPKCVPDDGQLVHGNELLVHLLPGYPQRQLFGVSEHTLEHVFAILQDVQIQMPIG